MGHYYSEMCCSTCGRIPCECPRKPDMTPFKWMVDPKTLEVMQVKAFDSKYAYNVNAAGIPLPVSPHLMHWNAKLFEQQQEAIEHRIVVLDGQIAATLKKAQGATLKLKELREKRREYE